MISFKERLPEILHLEMFYRNKYSPDLTYIILFLFLFIFYSCSSNTTEILDNESIVMPPEQEIFQAKVVFTREERITSVLNAQHLAIYERKGLTIADSGFALDIYDLEGKHVSLVTADSGVVRGEDSLLAFGNVVVISDSGVNFNGERLFWDRRHKTIRSDTSVVVTTVTDTLYGDSLLSDEAMKNWQVFNPRGKTIRELKKESQN
jgi:LPS export ABC transporter protein LptC